eukprot:3181264-Rhodomonas_salina.4
MQATGVQGCGSRRLALPRHYYQEEGARRNQIHSWYKLYWEVMAKWLYGATWVSVTVTDLAYAADTDLAYTADTDLAYTANTD